jgi:hypothetical protein
MKLHDVDRERPFEAQIDARFPYGEHARCIALIAEARTISLNATFCVLDEICRPPESGMVTSGQQRTLIAEWCAGLEHDLIDPVLTCAHALIGDRPLPWTDAVAVMELVGKFDGQRAALSVAYFSGDCDTVEGNAALTSAERRIRSAWERKAV